MLYKRKDENENICILKFDRSILDLKGVVVSDCNASSRYASFYSPEVGLKEIDFKLVFATVGEMIINTSTIGKSQKSALKC